MDDFTIRITQRAELGDRSHERTIEIDTRPISQALSAPIFGTIEELPPGQRTVAPATGSERFERIFGPDSGDHVAVIDHQTGLLWSVESLGDPKDPDDGISQQQCIERCQQLDLLGHNDWRLPTRSELATLIDDTRHKPAIDVSLFPGVKPRWHWTSTAAAWSSASAWYVHFYYGGVCDSHRGGNGFALAVRRAGQ